ncbi:MAG: carbohydrate kinase family protein [Chloroflexota bacterium]
MQQLSASEKPVLVIGASGTDLVGRLAGEWRPRSSLPAHIRTSMGGVARNVAENLARLGCPVALLSAVGYDAAGDHILKQTAAAGVDVSRVLRTDKMATGSYLAVLDADGTFRMALDDMRAIQMLTPAYVRRYAGQFAAASFVFVDANLPEATLDAVMVMAHGARCPVCADPTSTVLAPRLRPYLERLALITPNAAEAALLAGRDFDPQNSLEAIETAKCLVALGVETVVITLGEYGICYATTQHSGYYPAIHTQVVDPIGAGDALTAAVLMSHLNDIPLDDAVRLGVAAASLTLRYPGAVSPHLSLEQLYDQI